MSEPKQARVEPEILKQTKPDELNQKYMKRLIRLISEENRKYPQIRTRLPMYLIMATNSSKWQPVREMY